jgi:membrane peptidoglycan carboxypeptidase
MSRKAPLPSDPRKRARHTNIQRRRRRRAGKAGGGRSLLIATPFVLVALALAGIGVAAGAAFGVYQSFADDLVEPETIVDTQRALGTSKVFDAGGPEDGTLLFEFADPLSGLRNPVRMEDVSTHLINATVSTEDASFFENSGINLRGLSRAVWENIGLGTGNFFGGSGGSSITQQLVKNVLIPPEERSGRTIERAQAKLKESILAIELTEQYSKLQILEWYLNTIFYGNLSYGIGAASERYFGKPAANLDLHEAALLAGLPQAPANLDPFEHPEAARARQGIVLDLMARSGYITAAEASTAKQQPLNFASREFNIEAPHFVTYVAEEIRRLCRRGRIVIPEEVPSCDELLIEGGLRIITTLDMDLQRQAEETIRADLATFEEQTGAHNAALVALDPATGRILAMVGSRDFFREDIDGQVNLATSPNSPGSSIKPITYAAAFVQDPAQWNPGTIVWDVPLEFREPNGDAFSPENFDAVFRGPVSARTALANSINIPAFRLADAIGIGPLLDFAHQVGITTMDDAANYGPSITLGGGDVTLLDLAYAYSVFANNGVMYGQRTSLGLPPSYRPFDPIAITEIRDSRGRLLYELETPDEQRVMPAPQAFQITSILADNQARQILYGLDSNLVLDRPAAAKTGTAGDPGRNDVRRDFWTVGYTPDLVTGVWVGNADNTPMTGGSSSRTAGLIWRDFMLAAHDGQEAHEFEPPEGLITSQVFIPRLQLLQPGQRDESATQNPCATISLELFVAEDGVPARENGICTRAEVDARTLALAQAETPALWRRDDFYLIPGLLPAYTRIAGRPDPAILDWLQANKVRFVGDDSIELREEDPIALDVPRDGSTLQFGQVLVRGRASSDELERWILEVAPGPDPRDADFEPIRESESPIRGQLTRWDTSGLEPGGYVLRLRLDDGFLGELKVSVRVEIVDPDAEPEQNSQRSPNADGR